MTLSLSVRTASARSAWSSALKRWPCSASAVVSSANARRTGSTSPASVTSRVITDAAMPAPRRRRKGDPPGAVQFDGGRDGADADRGRLDPDDGGLPEQQPP